MAKSVRRDGNEVIHEDIISSVDQQTNGVKDTDGREHDEGCPHHLPLIEFSYNNSFQQSIGMAQFEALYGRPCRSFICWNEPGERASLGPDLVRETTKAMSVIQQNIRRAQSRQKSYADRWRRPLEFEVGNLVFYEDLTDEIVWEIQVSREA